MEFDKIIGDMIEESVIEIQTAKIPVYSWTTRKSTYENR